VFGNASYWRHDRDGARLPYLDSIEFRPMPESQQRVNALEAGDIDAFHLDANTGALTLGDDGVAAGGGRRDRALSRAGAAVRCRAWPPPARPWPRRDR
jgi:ABC-type transport system substrate-binding protein